MENAGKLKALMMVAHPDDCIIFGYPFFSISKQFDWTICYLTYKSWEVRAQEMIKFWAKRSVTTKFLGFRDDFKQVEQGITGFDNTRAKKQILETANQYDLILTHNSDGEYGHIHHVFVHNSLTETSIPQIFFAGVDNFNFQCVCQSNEYDLDEVPIHRSVIEDFQDRHIGRYAVTDQARKLI